MFELSYQQVHHFKRDGLLIINDFYSSTDIEKIQAGIYNVIGQVMKHHGVVDERPGFSPSSFDDGYFSLIQKNRSWGGEVYDAVKQIPSFVRLLADPRHEDIFKALRPKSLPGVAAGGYGIRIDIPHEDKYRAMWHQEYPAQLRSTDGLVFWSPLVDITEALGPVIFCPGSHLEGIFPVCIADPEGVGRKGAYALKIKNEEDVIGKYSKISPITSVGDLVVIDFNVLHCSGFNRSDRARWSMQFRYFNFNDPVGRSHAWSGSFSSGVDFRIIHPELFFEE